MYFQWIYILPSHCPIWIWLFFHYSTSLWNVICESSLWFHSLIYFKNTMTVWIEFSPLQFMLSSFSGPILHSLSFIWCCSFMLLIVYWTLWYVRILHKSRKTGGNFKFSDTQRSPRSPTALDEVCLLWLFLFGVETLHVIYETFTCWILKTLIPFEQKLIQIRHQTGSGYECYTVRS